MRPSGTYESEGRQGSDEDRDMRRAVGSDVLRPDMEKAHVSVHSVVHTTQPSSQNESLMVERILKVGVRKGGSPVVSGFLYVSCLPIHLSIQQSPTMAALPSWLPRGGPAIAVLIACGVSVSAISYSHYAQVRDKAVMRAGVERDKERVRAMRARLKEQQR